MTDERDPGYQYAARPIKADHSLNLNERSSNPSKPGHARRPSSSGSYSSGTYPGRLSAVAYGTPPKKKPPPMPYVRPSNPGSAGISGAGSSSASVSRSSSRNSISKVSPSPTGPKTASSPAQRRTSPSPNTQQMSLPPAARSSPSSTLRNVPTQRSSLTPTESVSARRRALASRTFPGPVKLSSTPDPDTGVVSHTVTVGQDKVAITVQQNIINFQLDLSQEGGPELAAQMLEALGLGSSNIGGVPNNPDGSGGAGGHVSPPPTMPKSSKSPIVSSMRSPSLPSLNDRERERDRDRERKISPEWQSYQNANPDDEMDPHEEELADADPMELPTAELQSQEDEEEEVTLQMRGREAQPQNFGNLPGYVNLTQLTDSQLKYLTRLGFTAEADPVVDDGEYHYFPGKVDTIKRRPSRQARPELPIDMTGGDDVMQHIGSPDADAELQVIQNRYPKTPHHRRRGSGDAFRKEVLPPPPRERYSNNPQEEEHQVGTGDNEDDSLLSPPPALTTVPPLNLNFNGSKALSPRNPQSARSETRSPSHRSHISDVSSPDRSNYRDLKRSEGSAFSSRSSRSATSMRSGVSVHQSHEDTSSEASGYTS